MGVAVTVPSFSGLRFAAINFTTRKDFPLMAPIRRCSTQARRPSGWAVPDDGAPDRVMSLRSFERGNRVGAVLQDLSAGRLA